jgi:hypothetical protein
MKIHLTTNSAKILDNYLNLLPLVKIETANTKQCDPLNLDKYVDNGEAEEILIEDILPCFPYTMLYSVIDKWLAKLSIGGKIIIIEDDINILLNEYSSGRINNDEINKRLFSINEIIHKSSCPSMFAIIEFLRSKGLKILKQKIDNTSVIVEAQRI